MFTVTLKNGQTMDLNLECNYVDYSDSYFVKFQKRENEMILNLAIIPKENILFIYHNMNEKKGEQINVR